MEVRVRQEESSDEGISMKKSSEEEDLPSFSPMEMKYIEEKKGSEEARQHSKTIEFSLERKLSMKELRKDIDQVHYLKSRRGQVSLVMKCKDEIQFDGQKEISATRTSENPEANVKSRVDGEPVNLHLSQIKIRKWTKPKTNDADTLLRLKQVCGAFDGDSLYHYENIDDFDDIVDNPQPPSDNQWRISHLFFGTNKGHVNCKLQRNQNGVVSRSISCRGRPSEDDQVDQRFYFLGEIARGVEIIQCLNKGCTSFYDPWDVVLVVATKDAKVWYDTIAFDPVNKRNKAKGRDLLKMNGNSTKSTEALESEKKEYWWRRKRKAKKTKFIELPKQSVSTGWILAGITPDTNDTNIKINLNPHELKRFKFECTTCLEGFDDDLEPNGPSCGHYTCKTCLKRYFNEQLSNMITRIECPLLDCKERFNTLFILAVLDNVPFRNAYMKLYDKRNELDYDGVRSKSERVWHQWQNHGKTRDEEDQEGLAKTELSKSLADNSDETDFWLKNSKDYKKCPRCDTLTERYKYDGTCNIVICKFCRTKFCWICRKECNEGLHIFECPLYGNKKFSKRRRIANYVGYSAGLAVGVPLAGSLLIGTGVVALGTLIAVGSLSPPVLLGKKMHKYHKLHKSSNHSRRLSVIGGASLGVLGLPALSAWGVYKTLNVASKKAFRLLDKLLPVKEDPYTYPQTHTKRIVATTTSDLDFEPVGVRSVDSWSNVSHGSESKVNKNDPLRTAACLEIPLEGIKD